MMQSGTKEKVDGFDGNVYEISVGKQLSQTLNSTLYFCGVSCINTGPIQPLFPDGILKRGQSPDTVEDPFDKQVLKTIILDEIDAYHFLLKIFGKDLSWMFLHFVPVVNRQGEVSILMERAENSLRNHYKIGSIEGKIPKSSFKERMDDFVYICWLMNLFHQRSIPLGDVNSGNLVKLVGEKISFIDISKANQRGGLGKNEGNSFATFDYLPREGNSRYLENRFTNLTLDIYALICILFELLTNQFIDSSVMHGFDEEKKKQQIGLNLQNTPGFMDFVETFLQNYLPLTDVNQIELSQQVLINLQNFFSNYFNQVNIRQLDNIAAESITKGAAYPKELNLIHVANKFINCFGLRLVTNYDPKIPWTINWEKKVADALEASPQPSK